MLGPILFLIYINDLSSCSNFETTLYADDSVLTFKGVTISQTNLDCELSKIELWLQCNQLSLNTSKCSYLFFTKNKKKINLTINNQKINQSDCVKYLGVYLDDRLSWCRHIDYIVTKIPSATGALYKLRPYIPQSALLAVYYSLVYSHLVYGIICWGNTTKTSLSKLQVKQNRIIKLICNNSYQRTKLKTLYEKLQALNIKGIYSLEVAKFMVKVHLNKLPKLSYEYLIDFKKCSSMHLYSTRNAVSSNFYVQRTSLAKTNQSLRVSGVKIWNALPECNKEKTITSSGNVSSKVLKKYFLCCN